MLCMAVSRIMSIYDPIAEKGSHITAHAIRNPLFGNNVLSIVFDMTIQSIQPHGIEWHARSLLSTQL
jgi:hypothetical protein